jgi:hypothetical protein
MFLKGVNIASTNLKTILAKLYADMRYTFIGEIYHS